jgi:predicted secreted protein
VELQLTVTAPHPRGFIGFKSLFLDLAKDTLQITGEEVASRWRRGGAGEEVAEGCRLAFWLGIVDQILLSNRYLF